jgi:hypothetical protein
MSDTKLASADKALVVSEPELNRQLEARLLAGQISPAFDIPTDDLIAGSVIHVLLAPPTVALGPGPNRVTIRMNFGPGSTFAVPGTPAQYVPFEGALSTSGTISMNRSDPGARWIDFAPDAADIELNPASYQALLPHLPVLDDPPGRQSLALVAAVLIQGQLGSAFAFWRDAVDPGAVRSKDRCQPDPAESVPLDIDVVVLADPDGGGEGQLALLYQMVGGRNLSTQGMTDLLIPRGRAAGGVVSNRHLLRSIVRTALEGHLCKKGVKVDDATIAAPCKLAAPVPYTIDGLNIAGKLTQLEADVVGNELVVHGAWRDDVPALEANADFVVRLVPTIDPNGGLAFKLSSPPQVTVGVTAEWWVWLFGGPLAGFDPSSVAVTLGTVSAVVSAVLTVVGSGLLSGAFSKMLASSAPRIASLHIEEVALDDLTVSGRTRDAVSFPVLSETTRPVELFPGQTIDLDVGYVGQNGPAASGLGADLTWDEPQPGQAGLWPVGQARVAVLSNISFEDVTPVHIAHINPWAGQVPASVFPLWPGALPLVLGALTDEGRYSKIAAWSEASGTLHISYVTYDRPVPAIGLNSHWQEIERRGRKEREFCVASASLSPAVAMAGGRAPGLKVGYWADYEIFDLRHRGTFYVDARLLAYPIAYSWTLDGLELPVNGAVAVGSTTVTVSQRDNVCSITTTIGEPLHGTLRVKATDGAGFALATSLSFTVSGHDKVGGCTPTGVRIDPDMPFKFGNPFGVRGTIGVRPDPGPFDSAPPRIQILNALRNPR